MGSRENGRAVASTSKVRPAKIGGDGRGNSSGEDSHSQRSGRAGSGGKDGGKRKAREVEGGQSEASETSEFDMMSEDEARGKEKGKGKGKGKGKEDKDDGSQKRRKGDKRSKRRISGDDDSDEDSDEVEEEPKSRALKPNEQRALYNELGQKFGIQLPVLAWADEGADEVDGMTHRLGAARVVVKGTGSWRSKGRYPTKEEITQHLKGKWRNKAFPEQMTEERMRLEQMLNPLITLLDVKLRVVPDTKTKANNDEGYLSDDSDEMEVDQNGPEAKENSNRISIPERMEVDPASNFDSSNEDEDEPDTVDDEKEADAFNSGNDKDEEADVVDEATRKRMELLNETRLENELKVKGERLKELRMLNKATEPIVGEDDEEAKDARALKEPPTYPCKVKGLRPRFEVASAEQESIGPLLLGGDVAVPAAINRFLRPYQQTGIQFLYRQYKQGKGGILGDDMGLGKTIQVIGFLSAVMGKTGTRSDKNRRKQVIDTFDKEADLPSPASKAHSPTCLIICPASVVYNWSREFKTWGYFDVGVYDKDPQTKRDVLERFSLGYLDVVIAGIEAARNDIKALKVQEFSMVIVDEAHKIKNAKSQTTIALGEFPTVYRYALTGTAIQNRLVEFWTLLNWTNRGAVGSAEQWKVFVSEPIKHSLKATATDSEIKKGYLRATALAGSLLPLMFLRRTKDVIADQLPKKQDNVVLCPLTPLQKRVYKAFLKHPDVHLILTINEACDCGKLDEDGLPYTKGKCCYQDSRGLIFRYIGLFQKISNHLALIYPNKEDLANKPERLLQAQEWTQFAFPDDWQTRQRSPLNFADTSLCAKWKILEGLLTVWKEEGSKVLIFSMSLQVLELLKNLMEASSFEYRLLEGKVPADERMQLVDEFNNSEDVFAFLISTRAGGVGLNLTSANKVVIFDPNFNPSHDLQAMDRAYRFGQRRDVDVYRLIGAGTLEEIIYHRQQQKRSLANSAYTAQQAPRLYSGVEGDKNNKGELYGVQNIFKLTDQFSLTKSTIEKCEMQEILSHPIELPDEGFTVKKSPKKKKARKLVDESDSSDAGDLSDQDSETELAAQVLKRKNTSEFVPKTNEQLNIAELLKNTVHTVSDRVLAASKHEEHLFREILHDKKKPKKKMPAPPAAATASTSNSTAPAIPSKRKPAAASSASFDPLSRGVKKVPKREGGR